MEEFFVECSNCSGLDGVSGTAKELLIAMESHWCIDFEEED